MKLKLNLNLPSSCLSLLSAGITVVDNHTWTPGFFIGDKD
jgi:hypothetical protein